MEDPEFYDNLGFILSSKKRKIILLGLNKTEMTPKEISKNLDIKFSQVSTILAQLKNKDIAVCINEEQYKGKIYKITEKGRTLAEAIEKTDQKNFSSNSSKTSKNISSNL